MSAHVNLGDLICRTRDPAHTAVIDLGHESGPRTYTYHDLDAGANAVAHSLLARGLQRGERVAIMSANRFEYLLAYYGTMRAGLVAVPLNHRYPREDLHFMLADCDARLVFCDRPRWGDVPSTLPSVVFGGSEARNAASPLAEGFDAFLGDPAFPVVAPAPGEPAMFLYTSGSSGPPKAAVLSHRSHLWVVQTRLGEQDLSHHRYLIAAPLCHLNALGMAKVACMAHATIVLLPRFHAAPYLEAIERHRCTLLTAVPPMMALLLRENDTLARTDLSSVSVVRMGSAPVSQSLMQAVKRTFPRASIINGYGTTEAGSVAFAPHPGGLPTPDLSVGCRHPLVDLRLIDYIGREGDQGVLELRCPGIMLRYHNRPAIPHPITADGYYVTGDVFRRDADGFYYFVGRSDDMFVCGGHNIYPASVERTLERHPSIAQAVVVPVDDDIKGQKPVAFVVLHPGRAADEDEIKAFVLANAPAYQHPRAVWFLPALPLSSTNKVDRAALGSEARVRQERLLSRAA